jgi:hypothetical protein
MMTDNPIIQTLMLFVGAYVAMNVLHKMSPADKIVTLFAGFLAAVIWMAHYNRSLLYSLSLKPVLGPVIVALCKMAKEQPPSEPAVEAAASGNTAAAKAGEPDSPKLLLHANADFASATRQLKEVVRGHNDVIEAVIDQIRLNVQLRDNSSAQASLPPIGVFVLIGKPGLGKKLLATEIGYRLYKGSSVSLLDVSDPGVRGGLLVAEARSNPFSTFVLENFHNCSNAMQEDLLSIVSGVPQVDVKTGAKVSFRNCFFFLLVHRDASTMERPQKKSMAGTGQTVVVSALGEAMPLDKRLAWSLHGIYPFVLPPPMVQAEVVALIIQQECKKYNITLGRVDPAILAREVQVISAQGNFEITPSRIAKVMHNRLATAAANKEPFIDVEDDSRGAAQKYSQKSY